MMYSGVGESPPRAVSQPARRMACRGWAAGMVALIVAAAVGAPPAQAARYAILRKIAGPASVTGWDYAIVDPVARQLLLSVYGSWSGVISLGLRSHRVAERVPDRLPHGIAILRDGLAAAANAATNSVTLYEAATGKQVASIATGKPPSAAGWHDPDSLLVEPKTGLLIAVNKDSGTLALVDVTRRALIGTIHVGGNLEAPAAAGNGTVYVNVASKNAVAVVDISSRRVLRELPLRNCHGPTGLAYDEADHLVISVCDNGVTEFMDPGSGRAVASLAVGRGADGVMYDSRRKLVFIAGGDDGRLSIIHVEGRSDIRVVQTLAIPPGTRLGAVDQTTGTLYLPTAKPDLSARPLRFPGMPPVPPAARGSFGFLVVGSATQSKHRPAP